VALGAGQVGEVCAEEAVTLGAVVLGIRDDEVEGAAGACVAQVVQGTAVKAVAAGAVAAAGATAAGIVAAVAFETGLGQIPRRGDAFGGIGDVVAGAEHGWTLRKQAPPSIPFTFGEPDLVHP
jgi:hypothetical protein